MERKLDGGGEEGPIGICVEKFINQARQGWGGVGVEASNICRRGDTVEVPDQEGGKGGGGGQGTEGVEKGLPLAPEIVAGRGMEMDEANGATGDELGMAWKELCDDTGDTGEDGDGTAVGVGKGELVPPRAGKACQRCRGAHFLQKNQVRVVLTEEGGQAAQIRPFGGVEREEGEERGHRLSIIGIMRSHLGC